jgi:hypothetical protein
VRLLARLALGGEVEPRDGEVEASLPEAVPHGGARGEQDGLAVPRVGGEEGGRRAGGEARGAGRRGGGGHGDVGEASGE